MEKPTLSEIEFASRSEIGTGSRMELTVEETVCLRLTMLRRLAEQKLISIDTQMICELLIDVLESKGVE